MSKRACHPKYEGDHEGDDTDDRIDETDVAGPLDEPATGERANRVCRPREHHCDADYAAEHLVRDDRLPERAGVDVEEDPETRAESPEDDGDPERVVYARPTVRRP